MRQRERQRNSELLEANARVGRLEVALRQIGELSDQSDDALIDWANKLVEKMGIIAKEALDG